MAKAGPASRDAWWKAIRTSELSPSARLLALALSTWMRADGTRCYPGQDAIAAACGWSSDRAVRRALTELADAGYVTVRKFGGVRPDGRSQATHRYVPTIPDGPRPTGTTEPPEHDDQPDVSVRENDGPTGRERPPETATNRNHTSTTNRTPAPDQPDKSDVQPEPHVRQGNQLKEVPSLEGSRAHATAADDETTNDRRREDHIDDDTPHTDDLLGRLPGRVAKHVTRAQRRQLEPPVVAELDRGWTPSLLVKAVVNQDHDLGPLDELKSGAATAKAIAFRLTRIGEPPRRSEPRPPCGTCNGPGLIVDLDNVARACPTCRPEGLGDTGPEIDRPDVDRFADLLEETRRG